MTAHVAAFEPPERVVLADDDRLDLIAEAFARVVDAKSPFTSRHSERVAETAAGIGAVLGLESRRAPRPPPGRAPARPGEARRAELVLDKPGKLTPKEWAIMRRHPAYTAEVLAQVECLRPIAGTAASHHERLDGSGYHRGLEAPALRCPRASSPSPTSTTRSPTIGRTRPRCPPSACLRSSMPTPDAPRRRERRGAARLVESARRTIGGLVPYSGEAGPPHRAYLGSTVHYPRWPGSCSHPLSRTPLRPTTRRSVALFARCFVRP